MGMAGIITPIANPAALATAYIHMLSNENRWRKAQKTALERVERYYREESFLERYKTIYREVS
jgi:glycosyltransferase involved in cell wall biosynthesis